MYFVWFSMQDGFYHHSGGKPYKMHILHLHLVFLQSFCHNVIYFCCILSAILFMDDTFNNTRFEVFLLSKPVGWTLYFLYSEISQFYTTRIFPSKSSCVLTDDTVKHVMRGHLSGCLNCIYCQPTYNYINKRSVR